MCLGVVRCILGLEVYIGVRGGFIYILQGSYRDYIGVRPEAAHHNGQSQHGL